ncbi:MAG: tRNA (adenine-N1)-methyltransferase [Chloroflexi bacterium]|nr:tRNA (adenine-N1)-methyltransferase [Chloroflexota bacterium]
MTDSQAQEGDLAHLVDARGRGMIVQLKSGQRLESTHGIVQHDDLIGQTWGVEVRSHLDKPFTLLQPALDDLLRTMRRNTQILYPKDIGYILVSMGIGPGQHILEAGTGSGALTAALAYAVGPTGHVTSYERRPETLKMAQSNLGRLGLEDRVTLKGRDIAEGFDETGMRAVYFDVPNPEAYLEQAHAALQPGGFYGCILPTTNQVSILLAVFKKAGFGFLEVSEILHRYYKPVARRLRPDDTMNAHTGYLVFARRVNLPETQEED